MRECLVLIQVAIVALWPVAAVAAEKVLASDLSQIPLASLVVTLFLSTLAGITALLAQMKTEFEAKGQIDRIWLFVAAKMTGSNLAGMVMYFGSDYLDWDSSLQAASIILAAFGGTWLIERALLFFVDKHLPLPPGKGNTP